MKRKRTKRRDPSVASKLTSGFVAIPFNRYVDLHLRCNPSVDRAEFVLRLRWAVDARKAGARCTCGERIWAIGSAEAGAGCFTCITGEAWPDRDYEIDEALGLPPADAAIRPPPGQRFSAGDRVS